MTALFDPDDLAIVPIRALQEHLVGLLEKQPRTIRELVILTGWSVDAIRVRLRLLQDAGRIHHQDVQLRQGVLYVWHAGPTPYAPVPKRVHRDDPRQSTVTAYPSNAVRDPFVAALFGAPVRTGMLAGILSGEG
ncbi:hypothetical protein E7V67_011460 [[Empedobacter] haloabium]|uniref:ArsR family transcriptional regulator n=1 Tax=[Empedobacter] haloabium TaxID=592317 RepID=A0ABZ1USI9_9BURK